MYHCIIVESLYHNSFYFSIQTFKTFSTLWVGFWREIRQRNKAFWLTAGSHSIDWISHPVRMSASVCFSWALFVWFRLEILFGYYIVRRPSYCLVWARLTFQSSQLIPPVDVCSQILTNHLKEQFRNSSHFRAVHCYVHYMQIVTFKQHEKE